MGIIFNSVSHRMGRLRVGTRKSGVTVGFEVRCCHNYYVSGSLMHEWDYEHMNNLQDSLTSGYDSS